MKIHGCLFAAILVLASGWIPRMAIANGSPTQVITNVWSHELPPPQSGYYEPVPVPGYSAEDLELFYAYLYSLGLYSVEENELELFYVYLYSLGL